MNKENCEPSTVDEIRYAICKIKKWKGGKNLISAELLKYRGEKLVHVQYNSREVRIIEMFNSR